jgi:lipopolysaccharide export system permease protein
MMVYISPAFLALTIPISVLVAPVVVFNQFSSDNEWVAMKSNGWSFINLMRPVLYFSLTAYLLTNAIIFFALPWGNLSFKVMIYEIVQTRASLEIKPNVFNNDFKNLVVLVKEKNGEAQLKNIFIADSTAGQAPKIIVAEEGEVVTNPGLYKIQLQLKSGTIHDLGEHRKSYQLLNFDRYDLTLDLPNADSLQKRSLLGNRELPFTELLEKIREIKLAGGTAFPEEVEVSKKFSIPFTCLIFGFIGAPLGIKSSRSGKSGSYAVAALAIALYYIIFVSAQNLGSLGKLNSFISVWIPNALYLTLMLYLVYKMQKENPFQWFSQVEDTALIIYQKVRSLFIHPQPSMASNAGNLATGGRQNELALIKKSNQPNDP